MSEGKVQLRLFEMATKYIENRFPTGWGGAAVLRTDKDNFFISIAIETANTASSLCTEVGAMCEAHKYNEKVTHSLCVVRDDEHSDFKILTPCGVCQERLRYWGTDLLVGITTKDNSLKFITLDELQPHHWSNAYDPQKLEHFRPSCD